MTIIELCNRQLTLYNQKHYVFLRRVLIFKALVCCAQEAHEI